MNDDDMSPIFGRVLSAMVTPFTPDGSEVDYAQVARLASYLVDDLGHDGLVINGTTGESPTTTDDEKRAILDAVVTAVGTGQHRGRRRNVLDETHHRARPPGRIRRCGRTPGRHAVLLATPVDALEAHFRSVADATELPVMLYDIPHRARSCRSPRT